VVHAHEVWSDAPAVLAEIFRVLVPGEGARLRARSRRRDPGRMDPAARRLAAGRVAATHVAPHGTRPRRVAGTEVRREASPFGGGVDGRHGWYRRLVLEA
jgi:hypothetical protein